MGKQLEIIVLRCQNGDTDAFEELFERYQPRLKYYIRRLDATGTNTDDMLQDIEDNEAYIVVPLTTEVIRVMSSLKGLKLHDRAIVATAIMTDTDLVSIDKDISKRYNRVLR